MSELLKGYPNKEIKNKALNLVQTIFETDEEPIEIVISEFTIILEFQNCEETEGGLNFYSNNNIKLTYKKNKLGTLCIVNILSPEVLVAEQKTIQKTI